VGQPSKDRVWLAAIRHRALDRVATFAQFNPLTLMGGNEVAAQR